MSEKLFHLEFPGFSRVGKSLADFKAALRVEAINVSFAVGDDFFYYKSGIYKGNFCAKTLNHAMVAVGYGVSDDTHTEYAILRNQWGKEWGEDGYIRVELVDDNEGVCGLYLDNTFTLVGYN